MNAQLFLVLGAVALGALGLVIGLYVWLDRKRIERELALRERLEEMSGAASQVASSSAILRTDPTSSSVLDRLLTENQLAAMVGEVTSKSGLNWSPGFVVGLSVLGILVGVLAGLLVDRIVAVAVGAIGAVSPFLYVSFQKRKRDEQIERQLPEAVDMLVNSLRAGYALPAAVNFVGSELPAPLGPEFIRFYDEQRLGMDVRQALQNLRERLGTLDARMFVLAVLIQRETGGNLSEILGSIATVIRDRMNFREQVKVLTAEANMSAVILSVLPVGMYIMMRVLNPEYAASMTTTETGRLMLLYGAISITIGYVFMRKLASVEM